MGDPDAVDVITAESPRTQRPVIGCFRHPTILPDDCSSGMTARGSRHATVFARRVDQKQDRILR
jgi:hypothetical protein